MSQLTVGGSSSSSLDLSKLIERSERLLATVEIQSQRNSMAAGATADRSWEQLSREAEKKLNQDIPQFQRAVTQSDLGILENPQLFTGRSKLNALLSDVRFHYQDRELTGLVLGQDTVDAAKFGSGGGTDEPAFINNLHSTILVSVQEQQKKGLQKAHWRMSQKLHNEWDSMKKQIMHEIRCGNDISNLQNSTILNSQSRVQPQQSLTGVSLAIERNIVAALVSQGSVEKIVLDVSRLSMNQYANSEYQGDLAFIWNLATFMCGHDPFSTNLNSLIDRTHEFLRDHTVEQMRTALKTAQLQLSGEQDLGRLLINYGKYIWDDARFPCTANHCWFLVFFALRTRSVDLLNSLNSDPRMHQCVANTAEASTLFTHVIPALASLMEGTGANLQANAITLQLAEDLYSPNYIGQQGSIYRELVILLVLGRPFPLEEMEHHRVDAFASIMLSSENFIWYGLLNVKNNRLGLEEFQTMVGDLGHRQQGMDDVKFLFLSLQFSKMLKALKNKDPPVLSAAQVHLAVVLAKAKVLDVDPEPFDFVEAVLDYAGKIFDVTEQLKYLRILGPMQRKQAYVKILKTFGSGEALIGHILNDGSHQRGLLELCAEESGDPQADVVNLMREIGHEALKKGRYIDAIRLLHLGQKYDDVLLVLQRCLRLPVWDSLWLQRGDSSAAWIAKRLEAEIRRFLSIYADFGTNFGIYVEDNLNWKFLLKLWHLRQFNDCVRSQQYAEALEIFDREQFLAWEHTSSSTSNVLSVDDEGERVQEDSGAIMGDFFPLDSAAIVETYLTLLTNYKTDARRIQALQTFLSTHTYINLSQSAQSLLSQLSLRT